MDENPSKTKAEAIFLLKETGIKGQLDAIEMTYKKEGISANNYNNILSAMDIISSDYNELLEKTRDDQQIAKKIQSLKSSISKMQVKIFPKLRKAFADNAKRKLWEEDIKVQFSGTSISFIGHIYASNKNIKDFYETMSDVLNKLRFKRVNFKWTEYAEYTYYTISSSNDNVVE
jgi:hypothetical protein